MVGLTIAWTRLRNMSFVRAFVVLGALLVVMITLFILTVLIVAL